MALLDTIPPLSSRGLRHLAAALATYWDQPPDVQRALVAHLPELVNDLRAAVGDEPTASADDCPALLLRQFDRAARCWLSGPT